MDDLNRSVSEAETTDDAVALLVAQGFDLAWARQYATISRGEHPGDNVDLSEWEQTDGGGWKRIA